MSKKDKVSDEDATLFRRAAGVVRPLEDDRVQFRKPRPKPSPRADKDPRRSGSTGDDGSWPEPSETGEEQLFRRAGLQYKLMRRLRRGQIAVEAELDLHGKTVREARQSVAEFVERCRASGRRCVRIIHGKGHGSRKGQAVIKWQVDRWLRDHEDVLAFCSARPQDGGTGALYVLLKA